MKKYIRHNDDEFMYKSYDTILYSRRMKSPIRKINCLKEFSKRDNIRAIKVGNYKVVNRIKIFSVRDGFMKVLAYTVAARLEGSENSLPFIINEEDLKYENGFDIGRVLMIERLM